MPAIVEKTVAPVSSEISSLLRGDRVVQLKPISFATYRAIRADIGENNGIRLTLDEGNLEIMSPSLLHERTSRALALIVQTITDVWRIPTEDFGSTTFERDDVEKAGEPDACFYIRNYEAVRNKQEIDPKNDPGPDLVIEVDITSPSVSKFPLYAKLGVPEIWLYRNEQVTILRRDGEQYNAQEQSEELQPVTATVLTEFLRNRTTLDRLAWFDAIRSWAQQARTTADTETTA